MSGRGASSETTPMALRLPEDLRRVLPEDTALVWTTLAPVLPAQLYLGGGTAVAVHLKHRESRDLDFFFHEPVDLNQLEKLISEQGSFAMSYRDEGTLRGVFSQTKLEVFDASALKQLAPSTEVAGLRIASMQDLMAMKIKVMAQRGEMRDYFDVKTIDEQGGISVEEGIELYAERYNIDPASDLMRQLYLAMGYLDDVEEDESLPTSKEDLAAWWRHRQAQVLRNSSRFS
jgi:hypothetical protein